MDESSRKEFAVTYYDLPIKNQNPMQVIAEVNGQAVCERVLAADSRIKYSSYISSDGSRSGEALDKTIGRHDKLTVMILPLHPSCDVMVLATPRGSDIADVLRKAKLALT